LFIYSEPKVKIIAFKDQADVRNQFVLISFFINEILKSTLSLLCKGTCIKKVESQAIREQKEISTSVAENENGVEASKTQMVKNSSVIKGITTNEILLQ
jgi:hypothetical protein